MANVSTNKEQDEAHGHTFEGHHLLFTGQAGTGKTQTIKSIYHDLKACDKNIALLCTTGIGCLQYVEIGAATVHRDFIETQYVALKKANPKFPVLIRECSGVEPKVYARYEYGKESVVDLNGKSGSQVMDSIKQLAEASP